MPNEAIERAARAIYEAQGLQAGLNPPWESLNAPQREPYLRETRVAISAYFADVPVSEAMRRVGWIQQEGSIEGAFKDMCRQHTEELNNV